MMGDMQQGKLVYDIQIEIALSGAELKLLTDVARGHYDYGCKTYFTASAQRPAGARWRDKFYGHHGVSPEDALEKVVAVWVSSSELDRCRKILGMSSYMGVPATTAAQLHLDLTQAFDQIQKESQRLNPSDLEESVPTP